MKAMRLQSAPVVAVFFLTTCLGSHSFAQDFSLYKISRIADGFRHATAPVWSSAGYLLFADEPSGRIMKLASGQRPQVALTLDGWPSGLAIDDRGRVLICDAKQRAILRWDQKSSTPEVLAGKWEGKPLNGPHAITARDGHVFFTDPGFGSNADRKQLDFYGVFRVNGKDLTPVARWDQRPTAVAVAKNSKEIYVASADEHLIRICEVDKAGEARTWLSGIKGLPQALLVDPQGNVYVAAGEMLYIYSPDAKQLHSMEFSERLTGLTFGDADMKSVFVTAHHSLYRLRVEKDRPLQ